MTCIVGVSDGRRVFIGGDSAGVDGLSIRTRLDRKVFRNGAFVFGFTTSFRMGQILAFCFSPPEPPAGGDLLGFMCSDFIGRARTALRDGGFARTSDGVETGGTFLVGVMGRLFRIDNDFQVGEVAEGWDACGCGEDYALGHLWATRGAEPRARVLGALEAAEGLSAGVRRPFVLLGTAA